MPDTPPTAAVVLVVLESEADEISKLVNEGLGGNLQMHVARGATAEMLLEIFEEPELGGGRHDAIFTDEGWVIEHSLVCRRSGEMAQCPFIEHVRDAWDELEPTNGRYRLAILPQVGFTTPERLQLDLEEK